MKKRPLRFVLKVILAIFAIALVPGRGWVDQPSFLERGLGKVVILAHGAGQGVAPTNTILALRTAQKDGADILEVDVQLTRDSVLILHHDDTLDRTTDLFGPVASLTWAQIEAADKGAVMTLRGEEFSGADTKVVRLDTALAAFPFSQWNIEIKNNSAIAAQRTCDAVRLAGLTNSALIASFHEAAIRAFRRFCPEVATSMTPNEIRSFFIASHLRLSRFIDTPAVAVQVPVAAGGFDLTNARFINALKARNIKLHYWTINDPAQMAMLIDAGADGLLTDFVGVGQQAVLESKR